MHSHAFSSPHVGGVVDVVDGTVDCCRPDADHRLGADHHPGPDDDRGGPALPPGHEHKADGHVDHAVDRPRAASGDAVAGPERFAPSPAWALAAPVLPAGAGARCGADGVARAPDGASPLALNCVRRQ